MGIILFVACSSAAVIFIFATFTVMSGYWKRPDNTHKKNAYLLMGSFGAICIVFAAIVPLIRRALKHPIPHYLVIGRKASLSAALILFLVIFFTDKKSPWHKIFGWATYVAIAVFIAIDCLMIPCFLP